METKRPELEDTSRSISEQKDFIPFVHWLHDYKANLQMKQEQRQLRNIPPSDKREEIRQQRKMRYHTDPEFRRRILDASKRYLQRRRERRRQK